MYNTQYTVVHKGKWDGIKYKRLNVFLPWHFIFPACRVITFLAGTTLSIINFDQTVEFYRLTTWSDVLVHPSVYFSCLPFNFKPIRLLENHKCT